MIETGKFPDRSRFLPHVPKRLRTIVRTAMSVDPSKRYQSAREMADVLGTVKPALDWEVAMAPEVLVWTARRADSPDLLVKLSMQPWDSKWEAAVYTKNSDGVERAKGRSLYRRESLTLPEAHKHLKIVFAELK
jgi:hypothetical protein